MSTAHQARYITLLQSSEFALSSRTDRIPVPEKTHSNIGSGMVACTVMMHAAKRIALKYACPQVFIKALSTAENSQFVVGRELQVICADQVQLAATVFEPPPEQPLKSAILMVPATGVNRRLYSKFAHWLSMNGHAVITFQQSRYWRLPRSTSPRLQSFHCGLGCSVYAGCLVGVAKTVPRGELVPHCWAQCWRQIIGLMHNATDEEGKTTIRSMFNVSCSSGSVKNMPFLLGLQASWFLNMFIPINNQIFGYSNTQWLGMGGPLPCDVGR